MTSSVSPTISSPLTDGLYPRGYESIITIDKETYSERKRRAGYFKFCAIGIIFCSVTVLSLVLLISVAVHKQHVHGNGPLPMDEIARQRYLLSQAVPVETLSRSSLARWCRKINSLRGTTLNCDSSQSSLVKSMKEKFGYFNLPSRIPWLNVEEYIEQTPLPQYKIVNDDHLKMYYEIWPQKTGPPRTPVVCLGGWTAVKDWIDAAKFWSEEAPIQRTILTADLRGAGQTGLGPTNGDYSAHQVARDVADLVKQVFPNKKVFLIGGALGGKIALQSLLDFPDLYKGVVPSATVGGGNLTVPGPSRTSFLELMLSGQQSKKPFDVAKAIFSPAWAKANTLKWLKLFVRGTKFNRPLEGLKRQYAIAEGYDMSDKVDKINIPVLVLHGTDDQVDDAESGKRLAEAIGSNARFEKLDADGHAFWQMDPVELVHDAEMFFEEVENKE